MIIITNVPNFMKSKLWTTVPAPRAIKTLPIAVVFLPTKCARSSKVEPIATRTIPHTPIDSMHAITVDNLSFDNFPFSELLSLSLFDGIEGVSILFAQCRLTIQNFMWRSCNLRNWGINKLDFGYHLYDMAKSMYYLYM